MRAPSVPNPRGQAVEPVRASIVAGELELGEIDSAPGPHLGEVPQPQGIYR